MFKGEIVSINISPAKGTEKKPVENAVIDPLGIVGDAHAENWHRQISLLSVECIGEFERQYDSKFKPGDFAENLTIKGIDITQMAVLDKIVIGDVELEVTQIGKECHGGDCAVFRHVGKCVMPKEGIFTRVIKGGKIKAGDEIEYIPRPLVFRVITLSDRAAKGEYEDRSGPLVGKYIEDFFADKRWKPEIIPTIISDDEQALLDELKIAKDKADIVITTGGTGIGPRDITPETVADFCDKLVPGIMEAVRVKYGMDKPNALLSRSVAGVAGKTCIFAIPGSVKAVKEYMNEILKVIEHMVIMLNSIDSH